MRAHDVKDFSCSARVEGVRAQYSEPLVGDRHVECLFVVTEVLPILPFEPGGISGHAYPRVTAGECARELRIPSLNHWLEIERSILKIPVASGDNLDAAVSHISIDIGHDLSQRTRRVFLRHGRG